MFECENGVCKNGEDILDINGVSPSQGKILIDKNGNITYEELVINGYNCYKEQDKHVCSKDKTRKIFTENSIVINTSKESSLLDYNIYGSTQEVGEKTSNLWDEIWEVGSLTNQGVNITSSTSIRSKNYIPVIGGKTYYLNVPQMIRLVMYDTDKNYVLHNYPTKSFTPTVDGYVRFSIGSVGETEPIDTYDNNICISEVKSEYEPYGYKIPVKIIGKNLLKSFVKGIGLDFNNGTENTNVKSASSDFIPVDFNINSNYYLSGLFNSLRSCIYSYNKDKVFLGRTSGTTRNRISLTKDSFTTGTAQGTGDIAYLRVSQYVNEDSTGTIDDMDNAQIQLEKGTVATQYEPNKELITNIYIKEPLRCQNDKCDYIDFKNKKVVRYIEKLEDGTLSILNIPKEETVELPEILLDKGVNNISVETLISPSKIELEYYK